MTSRNRREGNYLGHASGHHVRGQTILPGLVRSRHAASRHGRRVLIRFIHAARRAARAGDPHGWRMYL